MSLYKNFPIDMPRRVMELDPEFRRIASAADLEVTYLLMKLSAAFLLPYERLEGTSGAGRDEAQERQRIRRPLELDRRFLKSSYVSDPQGWLLLNTDDFRMGPRRWTSERRPLDQSEVHVVLKVIRHAIAHSNLFFGGESMIQHVYLGNRLDRRDTAKYQVIQATVTELDLLVTGWLRNVQKLRTSPSVIWRAVEEAA
jgi:hypothetical protein